MSAPMHVRNAKAEQRFYAGLLALFAANLGACTERQAESTVPVIQDAGGQVQPDAGNERGSPAVCIDIAGRVTAATSLAWSQVTDMHCDHDEDCLLLSLQPSCVLGCTSVISKAAAEMLTRSIATIQGTLCSEFDKQACPRGPAPPCVSLSGRPACFERACTLERRLLVDQDAG